MHVPFLHLKKKYNLQYVINFAIHYKSEYLYDYISTKNKLNYPPKWGVIFLLFTIINYILHLFNCQFSNE